MAADNSPQSQPQETVQKVVHVHRNVKHNKGFDIFGIPITMETIQMLITGGVGAITIGMLVSEMQRRKREEGTNQVIAQLQQELADIRSTAPNVQLEQNGHPNPNAPPPPSNENVQPNYMGDSSMYYDYINNIDDNAVNDVNLNTIKPFMDNITDRAANIQQQQELYQQQRRGYDYRINGNPAKSQHMSAYGADYDAQLEPAPMPSAQSKNVHTGNTVKQSPPQQQSYNNTWIGKDGVARKQSQRPEIQINLA